MPAQTEKTEDGKEPIKPVEEVKPPNPESAQKFLSRLVGTEVKVDGTPPPGEAGKKPEEGKDKPKPAAKPAAKPAKKPAPAAPTHQTPVIDPERITAAATEAATRAALEHRSKSETVEEPKLEFSPQETKRLSVLAQMEKNKPEYKGIADRYKQSLVNLLEYAEEWQKKNPDKEFNQDDEEHEAFFKKNEIPWDDDDYSDALADLRVEEKIGAKSKEIDGKFAKIEQSERRAAATPKIRQSQVSNARYFYGKLGDQFKDLLGANGTVNTEVLTKLQNEDPIATDFAIGGADMVETYTRTTYELFNDLTPFDTKNPVHSFLNNFILATERKLMEQPAEDQLDNKGRQFLSAEEYNKKLQSNAASTQKLYWTFEQADVDKLITHEILKHTRKQMEAATLQFERAAKARGLEIPPKKAAKPEDKPAEKPKKTEAEEEAEEAEVVDNGKPRSPTATIAGPGGGGGGGGSPAANTAVDKFANKFLGT